MEQKTIKPRKNSNPARVLVLGFLSVVLVGAALLSLPVSSRAAAPVPVLTALFTKITAGVSVIL